MSKFEVGDEVISLFDDSYALTKGKIYIIQKVSLRYVIVIGNLNRNITLLSGEFVKNTRLNRILYLK